MSKKNRETSDAGAVERSEARSVRNRVDLFALMDGALTASLRPGWFGEVRAVVKIQEGAVQDAIVVVEERKKVGA